MLTAPPRFAGGDDIAAFAFVPLDERLRGRDLIAMIREAAAAGADRTALSFLPTGKAGDAALRFTRGELVRGAAAFARHLAHHGVGRGDVVASLLPNGPGTIAAAIGAMAAAVLAPVNYFLDAAQIGKLIAESGAKAVLIPRDPPAALADMFDAVRAALTRDARLIEVDTERKWICVDEAPPLASRALTDRVALFHTGGTTGLPKFVPLTATNIASGALVSQFAYGYGEDDNVLCAMPMFHVGGLFACSLFPLACGSQVSILGALGYRGDGVVAALPGTIADIGASVVVGPPTVMAQLASNPPKMSRADRLRLFVSGAAALPRIIGTKLNGATGVPVVEPWGLTEATLAVTSGPRNGTQRQGSVGLALPYSDVKAFRTDANGKATSPCDTDEIGVLGIHGPMVFGGYLNRSPEDQPFLADGWLDTGDLGRVDADGFVWVTGRAKELIKRGGHGIDPGMIEDALLAHPDVALAAAIGKPDAYAGEVPIAYVQPRPGAAIDPDQLIAFARDRITERAAVPKEVLVIDRLPLTAIGKVHKQTLKLDITRRVAEAVVRQSAGNGDGGATETHVEPNSLHGLVVRVRVPKAHADAVSSALAAFTFHTDISTTEEDNTDA
jgi:fatty-acyl-CoA synthase